MHGPGTIPEHRPVGHRLVQPRRPPQTTRPLLDWLAANGCSRVAVHFDVDTIDSNELVLGLGAEPGGLTSAQARRIVADVDAAADVVGFTIADFFPRQVMHLQQILDGFPLISRIASGVNRTSGDVSSSAFTPDKASFASIGGVGRSVGEPCIPGLYCLPLIGDLPAQDRRICAIGQRESEPPFEPGRVPAVWDGQQGQLHDI